MYPDSCESRLANETSYSEKMERKIEETNFWEYIINYVLVNNSILLVESKSFLLSSFYHSRRLVSVNISVYVAKFRNLIE